MKEETKQAVRIVLQNLGQFDYPDDPLDKSLTEFTARYFPAKNASGQIVGYAIIVKAPNGFGGDFDLMVGIDSTGKVLDTYVLNHKETPGLGDNMKKEDFKNSFAAVRWPIPDGLLKRRRRYRCAYRSYHYVTCLYGRC